MAVEETSQADRIFACLRRGDYGAALALAGDVADDEEAALLRCAQGARQLYLGQFSRATADLSTAFELASQLPRKINMAAAATVGYLGLLALLDGRPHEAREQFAAAQVMERALRRRWPWLNVTWGLGEALLAWGSAEYVRAEHQLTAALRQARDAANDGDQLEVLTTLADLALHREQPAETRELLTRANAGLTIEHELAPAIYQRRARLWLALGEQAHADDAQRRAAALITMRAATIPDAELRQHYLHFQQHADFSTEARRHGD